MSQYLLYRDGRIGAGQSVTLGSHSRRPVFFSNYPRHAVGDQAAAARAAQDHVAAPESGKAKRLHLKDVAIPDKRLHAYATGAKAQTASPAENFAGQRHEVGLAHL
jgi:hypothetical protein